MRETEYQDERGRRYRVQLPDNVPDTEAAKGVPIGPPDVVDVLGLPEPVAARLHNLLLRHELWDVKAVRKKPNILFSALQAALKIDVHLLMDAYMRLEKD